MNARKVFAICAVVSLAAMVILWTVIGIKLLDGNYECLTEAYIVAAFLAVFVISQLGRCLTAAKCPNCGMRLYQEGKYCPNCGHEIDR